MSGVHLDMTGENIGKECLCPLGSCLRHYPYGSVCRKLNQAHKESTGEYLTLPRDAPDIVERLRAVSPIFDHATLCAEAVEEIDRLRAALERAERAAAIWRGAFEAESTDEAAADAISRMRAALESIAANTCCDKCQEAALVARAALSSGETP